jgi:hypothetical protein
MQPYPDEVPGSFPGHFLADKVDRTTYRRKLAIRERADAHANNQKHKKSSSEWAIAGESLGWPLHIECRNSYVPLGVFAFFGLFGLPYLYPTAAIGPNLLAAHGIASSVYFVQNYGYDPVHRLKGNPP